MTSYNIVLVKKNWSDPQGFHEVALVLSSRLSFKTIVLQGNFFPNPNFLLNLAYKENATTSQYYCNCGSKSSYITDEDDVFSQYIMYIDFLVTM